MSKPLLGLLAALLVSVTVGLLQGCWLRSQEMPHAAPTPMLAPDIIKLHDVLARPSPSQAAGEQRLRSDLPVGEAVAGSRDG